MASTGHATAQRLMRACAQTRFQTQRASFLFGIASIWACYIVLVAWPVYHAAQLACFRYYDLGIYAQGIARLQLSDVNPWLSARQLHLFFDHVDPALWTAVPLRWLLGPINAGVVTEHVWIMLSVWPVVQRVRANRLAPEAGLLFACVLLFSPATLCAAHFPIHPTTWAMGPMLACVAALCDRRYTQASWPLLLLIACKEEFALCALVWGSMLVLLECPHDDVDHAQARRRVGCMWCLGALSWLTGVYGLRPLAGQTASYPSQLYAGVWTQGASYWVMRVLNPLMWQRFAILGLGIGPLCAVLWQRGGLWKTTMMRGALWGLGPCVLIRFFGMAWGYHYEACLGAGLLGWMMAGWGEAFRPTKREASAIIFGLAAAWVWAGTCADAGAATVPWGHYGHERVQCPTVPQRTHMLAHLQQTLLRDTASCVLVGQNLAPLLASHPNLYVLGGPQPPTTLHYEYVWVEVPPMGDTWPLDAETIRAAISMWRAAPGVRIIVDDAFMFAAHGWLPYPDNATFR